MSTITSATIRQNTVFRYWQDWVKPRSTDRDVAFRENTIRFTSGVLTIALVLGLGLQLALFPLPTSLVSFVTFIALGLVGSVASAIAVQNGDVSGAGYLLIGVLLTLSLGITLLNGLSSPTAPPTVLLTMIMSAVVLPRKRLLLAALVFFVTTTVTAFVQYRFLPLPTPQANDPTIVLPGFGLILLLSALYLRQIRIEFDNRLATETRLLLETQAARQEAEKANKAKSQFLANMSHELRTPLNAVIGYAEIMIGGLAGTFTAEQTKLLTSVQSNARRLLNLINDILDLSRVESGRIELHPEPLSPKTVLTDMTGTLQSLADKKGLRLELSFAPNTPATVIMDSAKLQQIAVNLLGNALKFTKQGKVEVLTDSKTFDTWEFKVCDTGIGISAEALPTIFDVFQQVDSTDSRQYEGTGLGLAIVKTLVEHMGGSVGVQSTVGVGTTFTVTLPKTLRTT